MAALLRQLFKPWTLIFSFVSFFFFLFKEASPTVFQMSVFSGDLKCPLLFTDMIVTVIPPLST